MKKFTFVINTDVCITLGGVEEIEKIFNEEGISIKHVESITYKPGSYIVPTGQMMDMDGKDKDEMFESDIKHINQISAILNSALPMISMVRSEAYEKFSKAWTPQHILDKYPCTGVVDEILDSLCFMGGMLEVLEDIVGVKKPVKKDNSQLN